MPQSPTLELAMPVGPRVLLPLVLALMMAACATRQAAPVEDRSASSPPPLPAASAPSAPSVASAQPEADLRPRTYTVKSGDTLQKIALDQGLDYRELAAWNGIENPNVIRVGQVLRLAAPGDAGVPASNAPNAAGVTTTPLRNGPAVAEARPAAPAAPVRAGDNVKSSPKALKEAYSANAVRDVTAAGAAAAAAPAAAAPAPADNVAIAPTGPRADTKSDARPPPTDTGGDEDRLDWAWPVKGKIVGSFSESANLKGIDIAGKAGDPVFASAPGRVVYAGSGLRGYGKLIIIKHNNTFLSAYAHNREILVKEGQQVTRGQKIAEMGNTDTEQVKLHFEIRRLGKPMDPVRYLPPA